MTKETKNKIKVDFDRTPLKERLKAKYLNGYFYQKILISLLRFVLLLGLSYIILFPFFSQISSSFMSPKDFIQTDVKLIPKFPTLQTYKYLITENGYFKALLNTFLLSGACALLQTFVASFVGYGFAKFKFKGNKLLFMLAIVTMAIPHQILTTSIFQRFCYFDIFGILEATKFYSAVGLSGGFTNTVIPILFMSATGMAFKNGLFILIMRQFFRGVPDELEESSYVDGYSVVPTYFKIILPLSTPMLVTVFILSFAWQWTDTFYSKMLMMNSSTLLLTSTKFWQTMPETLDILKAQAGANEKTYEFAVRNTAGLLVIIPLVIMYLFCQRKLIQGIEHSGFGGT